MKKANAPRKIATAPPRSGETIHHPKHYGGGDNQYEAIKVIEAWEDSSYEGLEGPFFMRKCDHQAVQPGFAVQAVKDPKYPHLVPKILATYPGDKVTPKCRTEDF